MPHPPGPPSGTKILSDHEREKRRQQRPVSKSSGAPERIVTGDAPVFQASIAGTKTGATVSYDVSSLTNCTNPSGAQVLPNRSGLWLVSAWIAFTATPGVRAQFACVNGAGGGGGYGQVTMSYIAGDSEVSVCAPIAAGTAYPFGALSATVTGSEAADGSGSGDWSYIGSMYGYLLREA